MKRAIISDVHGNLEALHAVLEDIDRELLRPVLLGELNDAYSRVGANEQRIWKLLAYVGRYGHQPVASAALLPVRQLRMLADALNEIVTEENGPSREDR